MSNKLFIITTFFLSLPGDAYPGEVTNKGCRNSLMNFLHQIESKQNEKLEMVEFRHGLDTSKIFKPGSLKIVPVPMMKEIFGIYRREPVARTARNLFSNTKFIGDLPNSEFTSLLKPNAYYTYVVDDEKIVFAQTRPGKMRDYGSKHAILRDQSKDLHLAGEFHLDEKGIFHFDGASGTFQPPNEVTQQGLIFFRDYMSVKNAEVHLFDPSLMTPVVKSAESKVKPTNWTAIRSVAFVENLKHQDLSSKSFNLEDEKGQLISVSFELASTDILKETIYDTSELSLLKKNSELRSGDRLPIDSTPAILAKKKIGEGEKLIPVAKEERISRKFTAKNHPDFSVTIDEINYRGLSVNLKDREAKRFEYKIEGSKKFVTEFQKVSGIKETQEEFKGLALETFKKAN
jgi:hypothetical protein